jgi:hypothetical protein
MKTISGNYYRTINMPVLADTTISIDEAIQKLSEKKGSLFRTESVLSYTDQRIIHRIPQPF